MEASCLLIATKRGWRLWPTYAVRVNSLWSIYVPHEPLIAGSREPAPWDQNAFAGPAPPFPAGGPCFLPPAARVGDLQPVLPRRLRPESPGPLAAIGA